MTHSTVTKHHCPPHMYRLPGTFTIKVIWGRHKAYHTLLGVPRTFEAATLILADIWLDYCDGNLSEPKADAFKTLFGKPPSFAHAMKKLEREWWTPQKRRRR